MKTVILVLIALFLMQNNSNCQELKGISSIEDLKATSKNIVEKFAQDEPLEAFKELEKIWILDEDQFEYLEVKSLQQFNVAKDQFGDVIDFLLAKEKTVEGVLHQLHYVIKYEIHGLRIVFTYYHGKDDLWYLNKFKWDDSLSDLLD